MRVFTIPSRSGASLYYFIRENVAYCEFLEGCNFLKYIFQSSFPPEDVLHGSVQGRCGKKYSNRNWKYYTKTKNSSSIIKLYYLNDIGKSLHEIITPTISNDFIPFRLLFSAIKSDTELHDNDKSLYNNIINSYDTSTLEDFHQCARLRVHSLLLIV